MPRKTIVVMVTMPVEIKLSLEPTGPEMAYFLSCIQKSLFCGCSGAGFLDDSHKDRCISYDYKSLNQSPLVKIHVRD